MNRTIRLPLVIIFLALLFFVPLMVQTVLSADPTPTPGASGEFPLVPTPMAPAPEMRTMAADAYSDASLPPTLHETDISQTAFSDHLPHIAFNPDQEVYLVIWQDREFLGQTDLYGTYLDLKGRPIGSNFLIEDNITGPVESEVLYGNGVFLVIWREGEDIYHGSLQIIRVNGSSGGSPLLDVESILINNNIQDEFTGIYDPVRERFLILWLDPRHPILGPLLRGEIYGRLISPDGDLLGSEFNLLPFHQNPGLDDLQKVLNAPSASGEMSIAHNPISDHYLITFSNCICTNVDCSIREEVRGLVINAEDFYLVKNSFGITANLPGQQWQARTLYNSQINDFLILWSDNRDNEEDHDLYGQIITGRVPEYLVGSNFPVVQGEGSQVQPEGVAIPGDSTGPAFALVWQHEPEGEPTQIQFQFLDKYGEPLGQPQVPSNLQNRTRTSPDLVVDNSAIPKVNVIWKDYLPSHESDIHGRLILGDKPLAINLQSPVNFTMVLSVQPTLRWSDVPEAVRYRVGIYDYSGEPPYTTGIHFLMDAEDTRDEGDPTKHSYKVSGETMIGTGSTLGESGHFWRVYALDAEGNTLGVSLFGIFQIPPLGLPPQLEDDLNTPNIDESTMYDLWNKYDSLIYEWSEARDIPPNLMKAIIAKETGGLRMLWGGRGDPTSAYLYEAKHDLEKCARGDACALNPIGDYLQPIADVAIPLPGYVGSVGEYLEKRKPWTSDPTIAEVVGDKIGVQITSWTPLAKYVGCPASDPEFGSDLYQCLRDKLGDDDPYAQYRVMAGYGLGGVNYWQVYQQMPSWIDGKAPPPENLYDDVLNIKLSTLCFSRKRCIWMDASLNDPDAPNIYLSAQYYKDEDFDKWFHVIANYNGWKFGYPRYYNAKWYTGLVADHFFGTATVYQIPPVVLPQPVDLSGFSDYDYEVQIQIESVAPLCTPAVPSSQTNITLHMAAEISINQSSSGFETELNFQNEVIVDEQPVDFQGDNQPEWAVLLFEEDPEYTGLKQAFVEIYSSADRQDLLWRSPPITQIESEGFGFAVDNPTDSRQFYQLSFYASLHSERVSFVQYHNGEFILAPFFDTNGIFQNSIVSDGAGVVIMQDGSLAVYSRGFVPIDQEIVTVYAYRWGSYRQERTYTYDRTVEDTAPPVTTAVIEPLPNLVGWNTAARVVLTAADDQGVDFLDYTVAGASGEENQRSYLSQVWFPIEEGVWTIRYQATDIYGNPELEGEIEIKVDQTPPVTNVQLLSYPGPPSYLSNVLVVVHSEDGLLGDGSPGSGLARTEISLDEGLSWNPVLSHVNISELGEYIVWVRGVDNAGNLETPVIKTFEILPHSITLEVMTSPVADEGDLLAIETSFTDIDQTASHIARVHWDDDTPMTVAQVVEVGPGQGILQADHIYQDNGFYEAFWMISNNQGEFLISYFPVTINNLPPEVEAGEDLNGGAGEEITFNGSFTDPGELDTHIITWDFGDGETEVGTLTPAHVYNNMGSYTATLTVTDDDGGVGSDTLTVTVSNVPPQVSLGGGATINEGEHLTRAGSFTDPGSESWTGEVDYGEGADFEPFTLNPDNSFDLEHLYPDDGNYTVTVQITDELNAVGEDSFQVIVNNIAPEVTLSGVTLLSEGETFTGGGSFIDPGADSWTATIDYDNGQGPQPLILTEQAFTLEQLYPEDGIPAVTVCVTDDDGGAGCAVLTLTVENLPPSVVAGEDMTAETGEEVAFSGAFSDPGILDTHTIVWDFGDGETGGGTFTPTHIYSTPGSYPVTLTVTDDEGAAGSDSLTVEVTQSQPENLIVLNDWRSDHCLALDMDTGDYSWYADGGEVYTGTVTLVERGQVVLFRSLQGDPKYLRGLLLLRPEMGTARMWVGSWFGGRWMFILDRDFTEPTVCQ